MSYKVNMILLENYYSYRMAELKKEEANKFYNTKQYDKALVLYNEVIGQ